MNEQEKEHDRSVWCKNTGVQWLTWNKYAAVSIRIGKHPFSIIDVRIPTCHFLDLYRFEFSVQYRDLS